MTHARQAEVHIFLRFFFPFTLSRPHCNASPTYTSAFSLFIVHLARQGDLPAGECLGLPYTRRSNSWQYCASLTAIMLCTQFTHPYHVDHARHASCLYHLLKSSNSRLVTHCRPHLVRFSLRTIHSNEMYPGHVTHSRIALTFMALHYNFSLCRFFALTCLHRYALRFPPPTRACRWQTPRSSLILPSAGSPQDASSSSCTTTSSPRRWVVVAAVVCTVVCAVKLCAGTLADAGGLLILVL